jgi:predicted protein tyrosine phosphatase
MVNVFAKNADKGSKMKNMKILAHGPAGNLAESQPGLIDFVFLTDPNAPFVITGSEKIIENCREFIRRDFHDIELPRERGQIPTRKDVQLILDWIEERKGWMDSEDDLLVVSCQAGISRSAGTAYVIACTLQTPEEALSILDPQVHWPNEAVVGHGADILGKPQMKDLIREWKAAIEPLEEWEL